MEIEQFCTETFFKFFIFVILFFVGRKIDSYPHVFLNHISNLT